MAELSEKRKAFADALLQDPKRDRIKAYRKVYKVKTDKAAEANASRLLSNDKVQAYIAEIENKTTEKVELSVQWVKDKLKRFSEAKITDYFEIRDGGVYLKDLHDLPPEIVDCIQEIHETKDGIKIKLVDKKSSVTDIARTMGMFTDNINVNELTFAQVLKKRKEELENPDG